MNKKSTFFKVVAVALICVCFSSISLMTTYASDIAVQEKLHDGYFLEK